MTDLAEILEQKGHELKMKTADEYATSCPFCGGVDRFCVWSEKNTYWCRQCERKGGWIWNIKDIEPILYRVSQVIAWHNKDKSQIAFSFLDSGFGIPATLRKRHHEKILAMFQKVSGGSNDNVLIQYR